MSWIQIQWLLPGPVADPLGDLCLGLGALSTTLVDAAEDALDPLQGVLEPPPGAMIVWENVVISSLWAASSDFSQIRQTINQYLLDKGVLAEFKVDFIEEGQWMARWSEPQAPLPFADGALLLVPRSWSGGKPDEVPSDISSGTLLRLDAGLAFGSGQHPTTSLCLEWIAQHRWDGMRVLDYGCGSGVLGLACLLRGASEVVGVDYDPQALIASRDNAAFNHCDQHLILCAPGAFTVEPAYDLVVANILANPLIELAPLLSQCLTAQGTLILAGLLAEQVDQVRHAYPDIGFEKPVRQGEWIRLEGTRAAA